jgi:glycosyltransferase involved in cell wall biosynthesis
MISIVVGYRNREIERVKRSLDSLVQQTYVDFEVIFVDYGSDSVIATHIRTLLSNYTFAKYTYFDTRGWFWNRAHALNLGIKIAKGDLVLIFDIDLILQSEFLNYIAELDYKNKFYTFNCTYYPENYKYFSTNPFYDVDKFSQSYVGICALHRDYIADTKGFDEYYMVWGVEDDDFYEQLLQIGVSRVTPEFQSFLIIHQWHDLQSPQLPSLWYLTMMSHFLTKEQNFKLDNIRRDYELHTLLETGNYTQYHCLKLDRSRLFMAFTKILLDFSKMCPNQIAWFKFKKPEEHVGKLYSIISYINILLDRFKLFNYRFIREEKLKAEPTISSIDVVNFLFYFVGTNRPLIADYYFKESKEDVLLIFKKK